MKRLVADFKSFLIKGDLVSLAVGLVMALVFAAVVKALIADLITPIIALIFGKPNFERAVVHDQLEPLPVWRLHQQPDHLRDHGRRGVLLRGQALRVVHGPAQDGDPTVKACPECTSQIPAEARRCPMCTAVIERGSAEAPALS